jgi:hypothetical protein
MFNLINIIPFVFTILTININNNAYYEDLESAASKGDKQKVTQILKNKASCKSSR